MVEIDTWPEIGKHLHLRIEWAPQPHNMVITDVDSGKVIDATTDIDFMVLRATAGDDLFHGNITILHYLPQGPIKTIHKFTVVP